MFNIDLEWESIPFPLKLSSITSQFGYYQIPEDAILEITRDENYQLKAKLYGQTENIFSIHKGLKHRDKKQKVHLGGFLEDENFKAVAIDSQKDYHLQKCHIGSWKTSDNGSYSAQISIREVIEYNHSQDQVKKVIDWFLCGRVSLSFPRITRRYDGKKVRNLFDYEKDIEPAFRSKKGYSSTRDHFYIQTDNLSFIIQEINRGSGYLSHWSYGFAIEYREDWGGIPNERVREAIREIVGFLFGSDLSKIGTTKYSTEDKIVKRTAITTKDSTFTKCQSPAVPPINLLKNPETETILSNLISSYLSCRKDLKLSDVLWKYWIAEFLPIGTNLPVLSSALENLCEAYIKEKDLVKKYDKREKREYRELIAGDLERLDKKLDPYDFKKRTLDKLENPFNIGVGEKISLFFDTLGFDFMPSSIEGKALKSRNKMTHESLPSGAENDKKYIKLSDAYRTLVNRTILKVLGYSGNYIDYYTEGHPERHISENIGSDK